MIADAKELLADGTTVPAPWRLRVIAHEDNLTYLAVNEQSGEGLIVDPVREDWEHLVRETAAAGVRRWVAVIDTHTHADHVSSAARMAEHLRTPLIQHAKSGCTKVHLRVSRDTELPTAAGPLRFIDTPGHTPDGLAVLWGPFLFTGDTILYGDTGRDDLPGGDANAHWESLQKIKTAAKPDTIFCPGHDGRARLSSWKTQLEVNASLTQPREVFVPEAAAFTAPAPKHLKESLFENLK